MKTMKKFWKYFINFIVLFLLVSGLTYIGLGKLPNKSAFNDISYSSYVGDSFTLVISKCEASRNNVHVVGSITNNSNSLLTNKYIQFNFIGSNGSSLGLKFKKIGYFNVNENVPFDISDSIENASSVEISLIDELPQDFATL